MGFARLRSVADLDLAETFRRWRRVTRVAFLVAVALLFSAPTHHDAIERNTMLAIGLMLVVAVFVLYFRVCNRCPCCRKSFSKSAAYASDETSGLPLFNSIARCPFCDVALDAAPRHR